MSNYSDLIIPNPTDSEELELSNEFPPNSDFSLVQNPEGRNLSSKLSDMFQDLCLEDLSEEHEVADTSHNAHVVHNSKMYQDDDFDIPSSDDNFTEVNFIDVDELIQKAGDDRSSLFSISEEVRETPIESIYSISNTEKFFPGDESISSLTFMASMLSEDYDPNQAALLLREAEEFLRADKKTPMQYRRESEMKVNETELRFLEFMRKRKLEMNIVDARKIIKEKVLPKLQDIDRGILLRKEKHLNQIKTLRIQSKFTNKDLENFPNENYELKRKINDLETYIRLLKAEIVKLSKMNKIPNNLRKKLDDLTKTHKIIAEGSRPMLQIASIKKKSLVSSQSTKASLVDSESLYDDNLKLKKKITQMDQEHKVKIGQMKAIYERYLKELNKRGSSKQDISRICNCKLDQNGSEFDIVAELSNTRAELTKTKKNMEILTSKISENNQEIENYKKQIAALSKGILNKNVLRLKDKILKRDSVIEELKKHDCLEYQLMTYYGKHFPLAKLFTESLSYWIDFSNQNPLSQAKYFKYIFKSVVRLFFSPIIELYNEIRDAFNSLKLYYSRDKESILINKIESWKQASKNANPEIHDLLREIQLLEQENDVLNKKLDEKNLSIQALKMKGIYNVDILSRYKLTL